VNTSEFKRLHPAPDENDVGSLYKFKTFDENEPQRLTEISEHGLLYFPTPEQLNERWTPMVGQGSGPDK
jgi:hypothetical protein